MLFPHREWAGTVRHLMTLLAGVVWAGVGALPAQAESGLPQRNLLIEWRTSGQGQTQQRDQGIRSGQIIVDSRGGVIGRTSIGMSTVQTDSQSDTVQQVQVLNGGRARLFVGRTVSHTVWQWAWTGSGNPGSAGGTGGLGVIGPLDGGGSGTGGLAGRAPQVVPQVVPQTVWIDLGQGLNVRPRWQGGRAPVVVELEAQSRQPMGAGSVYSGQMDPDGQTRRMEVSSTLSVPLGEWAVVARSGGRAQRQQAGSLSTRELDDSQSAQLEIRVTAP